MRYVKEHAFSLITHFTVSEAASQRVQTLPFLRVVGTRAASAALAVGKIAAVLGIGGVVLFAALAYKSERESRGAARSAGSVRQVENNGAKEDVQPGDAKEESAKERHSKSIFTAFSNPPPASSPKTTSALEESDTWKQVDAEMARLNKIVITLMEESQ